MIQRVSMVSALLLSIFVVAISAAANSYRIIPIATIANDSMSKYYVSPPTGHIVLGSVPFYISARNPNIFMTKEEEYGEGDFTSCSINTHIERPLTAYILICGTSCKDEFVNKSVGSIIFSYTNGIRQKVDLTVRDTIRDWVGLPEDDLVITTTNHSIKTVWHGKSEAYWGHSPAVIMMLSVPLKYADLCSIIITDNTKENIKSLIPGLFVFGITVETGLNCESSSVLSLSRFCGLGVMETQRQ